jgi:hypothetical protein
LCVLGCIFLLRAIIYFCLYISWNQESTLNVTNGSCTTQCCEYISRNAVLARLTLSINTLKDIGHFWQKHFSILLVLPFHVLHFTFVSTNQDCPLVLTRNYVLEMGGIWPCDTPDSLFCALSFCQAEEWSEWVLSMCVTMARWRERIFSELCLTDLFGNLREEPTHDLWDRRFWVPLIVSF